MKAIAVSPLALLTFLLLGGTVGWVAPSLVSPAFVLGQIYLAVINMAAVPLMVFATFFGLRQVMAQPFPARRSLFVIALGVLLVVVCGVLGTAMGVAASPGHGLDMADKIYLGSVVQASGGESSDFVMNLGEVNSQAPAKPDRPWAALLPDNLFRALAQGQILGILVCTILFGLAFASMQKGKTNALMAVFEGAYRTFETIIGKVNLFIPVLVFGVAAHFVANVPLRTVQAMASFLITFFGATAFLSTVGLWFVWKKSGVTLTEAVASLKTPVLISLASSSAAASIPDTIRSMSLKLGFSTGIVEMVVPSASIFLRAGSAVYFALLAVFVANVYDTPLDAQHYLWVCLGSVAGAFLSAGRNGFAIVGFGSVVLAMLGLPIEAAVALFLAIDLICEGPRNLVSLTCCCVLIVLVSKGLPSERKEAASMAVQPHTAPVKFAFSKLTAFAASVCLALLAALIVLAGIGMGQKMEPLNTPSSDVSGVRSYSER